MTGVVGSDDALADIVARSLDRPVPPDIDQLVAGIASRPGVAAVLFYGNRLRDPASGGLADLYVLTDDDRAWSGAGLAAVGNRLLPPNVYHLRADVPRSEQQSSPAGVVRPLHDAPNRSREDNFVHTATHEDRPAQAPVAAKVAVMRLAAFRHRVRRGSRDTTLWARFAQPSALVYARDEAAREATVAAVAEAWRTAAWWADRLADGPDRWAALFAATYGAELRPEGTARPSAITATAPELYADIDRLLPPQPVTEAERLAARRAWGARRRIGRVLNAARLVKAAMTFRGGAAYALDKIQRHAGPDALRPWERRLPWLAAPGVLLRLLLRGGLR